MAVAVAAAQRVRNRIDRSLRLMCRVRSRLESLRAEMERELNEVRGRYAGRIASRERRLDRMETELERLCRGERDRLLPDGRKSLETPFGRVGFRRGRRALSLHDGVEQSEACRRLREADREELVRVRESLDKAAVRRAVRRGELSPAELGRIGIELSDVEDRFYCTLAGDRGGR